MPALPDPLLHQRTLAAEALAHQLSWVLAERAVDLVLDVGANRGQFGRGLRAAGYTGAIVSFEPVASVRADLQDAAAADDAWTVLPWALGEHDATTVIHVVESETELSSLLPASDFGRAWKQSMGESVAEQVEVRRLDGLLDEILAGVPVGSDPRILLKLDTQGFDLAAVRGCGGRIGEIDVLLSEVCCVPIYDAMPTMAEQLGAYAAAGFVLAGLHPVSFDRPTLRVIEFDALLVRG